jgi:hypothetical protein
VARTLILLLIPPSPFVSHALAQNRQNPEAAGSVIEVAAEAQTPIGERPAILKSAGGAAPLTLTSIRTPVLLDRLRLVKIASAQPWQNSATSATSGQAGSQPQSSPPGSSAQKKSSKLKWILIGAAGGAAVGFLALKGKGGSDSGSDSNSQTPTPTVTAGPPVLGPPQ